MPLLSILVPLLSLRVCAPTCLYLSNNVVTSNMLLLGFPCRKVLACVVCGRLKSAFQIASRSGSVADVQYVAHQVMLSQFRLHYEIFKAIVCFTIRHSGWGVSPSGTWAPYLKLTMK